MIRTNISKYDSSVVLTLIGFFIILVLFGVKKGLNGLGFVLLAYLLVFYIFVFLLIIVISIINKISKNKPFNLMPIWTTLFFIF